MPEPLWADTERGIAGRGDRRLDLSAPEVAMLAARLAARGRVLARGAGPARRADFGVHPPL